MTAHIRQASVSVFLLAAIMGGGAHAAPDGQVVALTQTGCQFLEPEGGFDHGFETIQAADCVRINAETGPGRLGRSMPLALKPGRYVFRVTNRNVPYQLGFFLRAADPVQRAFRPKIVGGGIELGETQEYAVDLVPGSYVYSCPLNPTPDYPLIVRE